MLWVAYGNAIVYLVVVTHLLTQNDNMVHDGLNLIIYPVCLEKVKRGYHFGQLNIFKKGESIQNKKNTTQRPRVGPTVRLAYYITGITGGLIIWLGCSFCPSGSSA